jgi:hypothetical protein
MNGEFWGRVEKSTATSFKILPATFKSRDSSVGITTDYELDDRMIGVLISAGAGNFSLRHRVQRGSGAHIASYPTGTMDCFCGGKAVAA